MVSLFSWFKKSEPVEAEPEAEAVPVKTDELSPNFEAEGVGYSPAQSSIFDGEKFPGGFGITELFITDYWTLRKRSSQLFKDNLYALGLIRRLITNEINTGLTVEATPEERILGLAEESLQDWTEDVETRFSLWGSNPRVCDWQKKKTFGALQRTARREALIEGDVLVVLRINPQTKLPAIQLVRGGHVQSPLQDEDGVRKGHKIKHGVELDAFNRHAAYWVRQDDGTIKRIPAFGEKSGRRMAWMVYGTEKRLDEVRGQPLLSIVLQSLKEIDRYRDSAQRKAVINSILAMFIKKTSNKPGTLPVSNGAVRKDAAEVTDGNGSKRTLNIAGQIPGVVFEELQEGEEPVLKGGEGTDINFGVFEEAIIQAIAWANEIPPEILRMAFSNNYSASQAAINEFKIYLNMRWTIEGENFCQPVYQEWLIMEVLQNKINAPGFLEAWRNPSQYDQFGAWVSADWYGSIKPSTDMLKQVKASDGLVAAGYSTRAREARITTGTKFSRNVKRLKRENEQLVEANAPFREVEMEAPDTNANGMTADQQVELEAALDDYLEEKGISNAG